MLLEIFIVKLSELLSLPSHPTNSYPSAGVAEIVTSVVPSSYVPTIVETVPPSQALTVRVN